MIAPRGEVCDLDLLAYGDGRLPDGARRRAVEAWLRRNPRTADALARDRAAAAALRDAVDGALDESVPERLQAVMERRPASPRFAAPAIAAGLAIAFALGWLFSASPQRAAPIPSHAQWLEAASEEAARLEPATDAVPANAPDFSRFGLTAVSADDIAVEDRRLRRIVYLGAHGAALELLASPLPPEPDAPLRLTRTVAGAAAFWTQDGVAYRLAADLPAARLRAIAEEMRGQDRPPAPSVQPAGAAVIADAPEAGLRPLTPEAGAQQR